MHNCKILIALILDYNNIIVTTFFVEHVSKSAFKTAWQRQQKLFNHQVKNKLKTKQIVPGTVTCWLLDTK